MEKRKGARSTTTVDPRILKDLNLGIAETATLSEGLVVDFDLLARNIGLKAPKIEAEGIVKRMKEASQHLGDWKKFQTHSSDTVRGWACYALAADSSLPFEKKLHRFRTFAADSHFGVREWAWISLRPELVANLSTALELFKDWVNDKNPNVRRFACEITRPRGVWCAHIEELKKDPEQARHLLEKLKHDDSKYVRDSVANWLNDAGKSQPTWLKKLAADWKKHKPTESTLAILKRGLRSL